VKDSFAKEAPVPIETRVLVIQSDGTVRGASYVWDATQTEAHLQHTRTSIPSPDGSDVSFRIPSPQDCRFCHHPGTPVLAFTPEQLNRPDDSSGNQLVTLSQRHLFREAITLRQARRQFHLSALQDESATLEQRGRSYLHANCAFCHSPGGVEHLRMDLRFLKPDPDNSLLAAPAQLGHFAIDEELAPWLIAPGDPDHSAILRRLRTRHERHAMPYLGRSRVDHAAVAILEEWIRSLPCESSETP
jgi:mono/diheme cytochrome c family protein